MPYTLEKNGAVEQEIRTIVQSASFILHTKGLLKKPWADVCNSAVHVLSRTVPTPVDGKMHLELWTGS